MGQRKRESGREKEAIRVKVRSNLAVAYAQNTLVLRQNSNNEQPASAEYGNESGSNEEEDAEAMIHVASVVAKWIEEGGHRIDLS